MTRNRLVVIFLIVFIDLVGFGMILPLLPFYAESFGANAELVGLLATAYAAAQFVGAPVLGRLSDRFGRRPLLLVSVLGTAVGFVIMGFAGSLLVLFASRILAGLTGGNISVAQAYITDVTDEKSRTRGLGMIGAAFGLGFIIGPALGGALSGGGYAVPAFCAAGLSTFNLMAIFFVLPESLTPERRAEIARQQRPAFTPGALLAALRRRTVGPLLHTRFFVGLALATFQSIYALHAQYQLGLDARGTGYTLAYVGALAVVVQGVGIGWLSARISDARLILVAIVLGAIGLLAWAFTPSVPILLVVLVPIAISTGVLNTILNSALTKAVMPIEIGGTLGLSAAVESLTRVFGPILGGVLLERIGTPAPGVFGAILMVTLISYAVRRLAPELTAASPARTLVAAGVGPASGVADSRG
jgi:MFS transporter, DHA1 family, tetracycline resistance protein